MLRSTRNGIEPFLAARQVPIEYFRFFGEEHQELSLFITNVVLHLVPESIVLILGVLVCSRALKGSSTFNAGILAFGAAVSYFFWLLFYQVVAHTQTGAESQRFWQDFLRQFSAPWWPAVGAPLERRVRPQFWLRHDRVSLRARRQDQCR